MCLGIPGELLTVSERNGLRMGTVKFAGVRREVCLELLPDVEPGEWVLVHVGMALSRIDRAEAERAYRVLEALGETRQLEDDDAKRGGVP
jgi:hydrogenase expression/formation protein HypC